MNPRNRYTALMNDIGQRWRPYKSAFSNDDIAHQTIAIQQIPAPTFAETQRADYIEAQFQQCGFDQVDRDGLDNVYGWLGPKDHTAVILVSAHHDTVFPMDTDLTTRRDGPRLYGPGIGDNSLGVAALLLLARLLTRQLKPANCAICFLANSREEGLGNLDGIRLAAETIGTERIRAAVVLEGMALGRIYHGGIAVRRFEIVARAEGGHSWTGFGKPSAIHGLAHVISDITHMPIPESPRTTFNIGLISGGHSINSIATEATCMVDLRSTEAAQIDILETHIQAAIDRHTKSDLWFNTQKIGERPSGYLAASHPLVELAMYTLQSIGIAGVLEHGSTDANMLLAKQIPAIVVGISYGGNSHRLDEFIETPYLQQGFWQLLLLVSAIVDLIERNQWS